MTQELLNQMQANPKAWIGLALTLYEIFVRYRPTEKNRSILALLTLIINTVIPNFKKSNNGLTEKHKF